MACKLGHTHPTHPTPSMSSSVSLATFFAVNGGVCRTPPSLSSLFTYVRTRARKHARTHASARAHTHTHTHTRARARARTHAYARAHTYTRARARAHTHTHTHTNTHAHTRARPHVHTHVCMHVCSHKGRKKNGKKNKDRTIKRQKERKNHRKKPKQKKTKRAKDVCSICTSKPAICHNKCLTWLALSDTTCCKMHLTHQSETIDVAQYFQKHFKPQDTQKNCTQCETIPLHFLTTQQTMATERPSADQEKMKRHSTAQTAPSPPNGLRRRRHRTPAPTPRSVTRPPPQSPLIPATDTTEDRQGVGGGVGGGGGGSTVQRMQLYR